MASQDLTHAPSRANFFSLPAELRNDIYALAIADHMATIRMTGPAEPAVLSACKQVRAEAVPMYQAELCKLMRPQDMPRPPPGALGLRPGEALAPHNEVIKWRRIKANKERAAKQWRYKIKEKVADWEEEGLLSDGVLGFGKMMEMAGVV